MGWIELVMALTGQGSYFPMIKAFSPSHFNLLGEPAMEILKVSSKGLDSGQIKRANLFSRIMDGIEPSPNKTLVHTIAMTASDRYGFNRNGDGWKEANLKRDHPTFETHAKVFRHHKNKSHDPSYGSVKVAMYNEDMSRVELLQELDNDKASEELSILEKEGSYPVSMAAKVSGDVCSICQNFAKTASEYCSHVKDNLGDILEDGRMVGVDNPESVFFDISRVVKPADRVAYTLRKAASGGVGGGLELAKELGYTLPMELLLDSLPKVAEERLDILRKLSDMEKLIDGESKPVLPVKIDKSRDPEVDDVVEKLSEHARLSLPSIMGALQKHAVMLTPREYLLLMSGVSPSEKLAQEIDNAMKGVYSETLMDPSICKESMYEASEYATSGIISDLVKRLVPKRSFLKEAILANADFSGTIKASSERRPFSPEANEIAKEYVRFQVETLRGIGGDLDFPISCTVVRNF